MTIKEFEIGDQHPQNPPLISTDELKLKYNLWGLLQGRLFNINLDINEPKINLYTQPDGTLNAINLLREQNGESSSVKIPFWAPVLNITVDAGTINFEENKRNFKVKIDGIDIKFKGTLEELNHSGMLVVKDSNFELNAFKRKLTSLKSRLNCLGDNVELTELRPRIRQFILDGFRHSGGPQGQIAEP